MKSLTSLLSQLWEDNPLRNRPLCLVCLLFLFSLVFIDQLLYPFIGENPLGKELQEELTSHPHQRVAGIVGSAASKEWGTTLILENAVCKLGEETCSLKNLRVSLSDPTLYPPDTTLLLEGDLSPLQGGRNPGEFNSKAYYACEDIYYNLKKATVIKSSKPSLSLRGVLCALRQRFTRIFSLCAGADAPFFDALVLGDKSLLSPEQKLRFQLSGIIHILAISGLHISLIGEGILKLLSRLRLGFYKRCILSLALVVLFGILTGGSVSTLRALTLFLISIGGKILGRSYDLPTALLISALLILLESPAYLYNASFLLSFGAVLSIGCFAPPLLGALEGYFPKSEKPSWARRLLLLFLPHIKKLPLAGIPLSQRLSTCHPSPLLFLLKALSSSLLVQLLTLPILLYFYGEVSLIGCLCNLVVLPTAGLVLGSGILTLLGGMFSIPLGNILILPGRAILFLYERLCSAAITLPFCTLIGGSPSLLQIISYYLLFFIASLLFCLHAPSQEEHRGKMIETGDGKGHREKKMETGTGDGKGQTNRRQRPKGFPGFFVSSFFTELLSHPLGNLGMYLFLLLLCIILICLHPHRDLRLTSLDIGQGEAMVIQTPEGRAYLSDGGSTSQEQIGSYQIIPYLKYMGISHLDGIFLSHTDEDHYNGIWELLTLKKQHLLSISISALYLPRWENPPEIWDEIAALAREAGVKVIPMGQGDKLVSGDFSLQALAPLPGATGEDPNADSLVLLLRYRSFSGLLTGDIEEATEHLLLPSLQEITFLKVAHHGSNGSSCQEFMEATRPRLGFISCALKNRYGHPGKKTIRRLEEAGCSPYYTMKSGALTCHTDGKGAWVTTFLS